MLLTSGREAAREPDFMKSVLRMYPGLSCFLGIHFKKLAKKRLRLVVGVWTPGENICKVL